MCLKSNQLLEVLCSKEDDFCKENDNYVHIKILNHIIWVMRQILEKQNLFVENEFYSH